MAMHTRSRGVKTRSQKRKQVSRRYTIDNEDVEASYVKRISEGHSKQVDERGKVCTQSRNDSRRPKFLPEQQEQSKCCKVVRNTVYRHKRARNSSVEKKLQNTEKQELNRLQNRISRRLGQIRLDEALIEAYTADGWKGSRACWSKVGLSATELKLARQRIWKAKADVICALEEVEKRIHRDIPGVSVLKDADPDYDGSDIDLDEIFCAVCQIEDDTVNNDIVLCDGVCGRAYHQKCHDPPLAVLPKDDEEWFCQHCLTKSKMMTNINNHFDTNYTIYTRPQDAVLERVSILELKDHEEHSQQQLSFLDAELPSEDEDDDNFSTSSAWEEEEEMDEDDEYDGDQEECERECDDSGLYFSKESDEGSREPSPTISLKLGRRISMSGPEEKIRSHVSSLLTSTSRARKTDETKLMKPKGSGMSTPRLSKSRRGKPRVDYQALSLELFGTSGIDGSDDEDYEPE